MYKLKDSEMIFIFTGPDGAGRKTVADMVGSTLGIPKVLSYTTRKARPAEADGQDYYFVTDAAFKEAIANDEFIEYTEIDGSFYGVKSADVEKMFSENDFIYVVLNTKGTQTLKEKYGEKVKRVYLYVSRDVIADRQSAASADEATIAKNLAHYDEDIAYMPNCRYSYENIDLAHTTFAISQRLDKYMSRDLIDKD
jgi:guanylate kinase